MALKDSEYGIWINRDVEKFTGCVTDIILTTEGKHYYTNSRPEPFKKFKSNGINNNDGVFVVAAPKELGEWL